MFPSSRVKKCGWLMKQGGLLKPWQRRWFVLSDDGRLSYYKAAAEWSSPGASVHLAHCTAIQDRSAFGAKPLQVDWPSTVIKECCFVISGRDKTLFLYASSKDECSAWLVSLQQAMMKASKNVPRRASVEVPNGRPRSPSVSSCASTESARKTGKISQLKRRLSIHRTLSGKSVSASPQMMRKSMSHLDPDDFSDTNSIASNTTLDADSDTASMASRQSFPSFLRAQQTPSENVVRGDCRGVLQSYQSSRSHGMNPIQLPPQVAEDIREAQVPALIHGLGQINAATGRTYSFLCNFGEVYRSVMCHLSGASQQVAAEKQRIGSIIYKKYLLPLSDCILELCEDPQQKQNFLEQSWHRRIDFHCGQPPHQDTLSRAADWWIDDGIVHLAVPAKHFGDLPFTPQAVLLPLPSTEVYGKDSFSVKDSGVSSYESMGASYLADRQSFSSISDRASSSVDELPEALKEDISNSNQLLQVALQVIGAAAGVPFTFECPFGLLHKLVDSRKQSRLGSIVHGQYLMGLSAKITEFCEDHVRRDLFVSNTFAHRIVLVVDDAEVLEADWGYSPTINYSQDLPVEKLSVEVLNATDSVPGLGGQLLCREGVLYMTVPLHVFGWLQYEPPLDIFECPQPGDLCSPTNMYTSPHCRSLHLPEAICQDLRAAVHFLKRDLEMLSSAINVKVAFQCDFTEAHSMLTSYASKQQQLVKIVCEEYLHCLCRRLVEVVDEDSDHISVLQKQMYNCKVHFLLLSELTNLQQWFGQAVSSGVVTFLHRGVLRLAATPASFGTMPFEPNIHPLATLPDCITLESL